MHLLCALIKRFEGEDGWNVWCLFRWQVRIACWLSYPMDCSMAVTNTTLRTGIPMSYAPWHAKSDQTVKDEIIWHNLMSVII